MRRKFGLFLIILLFVITLCSCQPKEQNASSSILNDSSLENDNNANTSSGLMNSSNSSSVEDGLKLVDRPYSDLSDEEKDQLKYFNDGYTFLATPNSEKWYLYKYGELFRVIDVVTQCPELYTFKNFDENYVVIDNCMYFCVNENTHGNTRGYSYEADIYKYDFSSNLVEKYIAKEEFNEFATQGIHMLKHNDNLVFICECNDWSNIVEVNTKSNPKLVHKKKTEIIIESENNYDVYFYMDFIPIDKDNYRIIQVTNNTSFSRNFSLIDYSYSDEKDLKREKTVIGYFYRNNENLSYMSNSEVVINEVNGKETHKSSIKMIDSSGNIETIKDGLPFIISESSDNLCYIDSKLSNDWIVFQSYYRFKTNVDGESTLLSTFVYYFKDKLLCQINETGKIDLWNIYSGTLNRPIKIIDCKENIYKSDL